MILKAHYNIYISACAKDGGIYHYQSSPDGMRLMKKYPLDSPMYLIVKGKALHCILRAPFEGSNESGYVRFDIGKDGELLNMTEPVSTHGIVACHLEESDGCVYCANYLSGNVVKLPNTVDTHSGRGVNPIRQDAPHTHFVCESPDRKYIFATDLGIDKIFVYNKDLTVHSTVNIPAGHGPRHLICSEDGRTVYCVNELKSTLSRLEYRDGTLALTDTTDTLPTDFDGENTAAAIRSNCGRIYISHRGLDAISVMNVSGKKPVLERIIPVQGKGPRDFWVLDGILICTNENNGTITVLDKESGNLIRKFNAESPISVFCVEAE